MPIRKELAFLCNLFYIVHSVRATWTPLQFTRRVGDQIVHNRQAFFAWDYGGALVFDGLHQANQTFAIDYTELLYKYLDIYETNPADYGYKLLREIKVPFGAAVGDSIGLFPIAYLHRVLSESGEIGYDKTADWKIVTTVAEDYLLRWPRRLTDGTFSRDNGWRGEPDRQASFLWGDDQYMGLTLLSRLAAVQRNLALANFAAGQALLFAKHMRDPSDGLFYHGYNDATGHVSCCKWGRANGWGMMSHVEVLQALSTFPGMRSTPLFKQLLTVFQHHAEAVSRFQATDGRFHQLVNETGTFLETSSTAMYITSMARGVLNDWLDPTRYDSVIRRAWAGLQTVVDQDGTVHGICMGTGIMTSVEEYQKRPTVYLLSGDGGLGSVLYAGVDMHRYLQ